MSSSNLLAILLAFCILLRATRAPWTLSHHEITCEGDRTVYWFTSRNVTNVVHFIFAADAHVRPPAVIVLHSVYSESQIHVDCKRYTNSSTFRGSLTADAITASYGVMIYQICDYIDVTDKASVNLAPDCQHYFSSNLHWQLISLNTQLPKFSATFSGSKMNDSSDLFFGDGSFLIELSVFDTDTQPTDDYYYKVAGGLGMSITLNINKVQVRNPSTRLVPVLLVFSNQSMEEDDDFKQMCGYPLGLDSGPGGKLPSTYLLLDRRVQAGRIQSDYPPAFLQFSPVSWTSKNRNKLSLRAATLGPRTVFVHRGRAHKFTFSLVYAYYGDRFNPIHQGSHVGFVGIREQLINLGSPGDGFYVASNSSSWTMVLSLGSPSVESANSAIGVPRGVLIAFGLLSLTVAIGVAVCYHRRRRRQSQQIFRFESVLNSSFNSPPSFPANLDVANTDPVIMGPVEPFQMRKAGFLSRLRSRDTDVSRQLLLADRPPDYCSVVDTGS